MARINLLPDDLANRIAAGEVVERPASVVKELVENSIDAGATRIEIALEQGGRELIEVTDDGSGMGEEDCVLSIQRFATSKISAADDLDRIMTMGFRGEALPAIAAVSELRIITRTAQSEEGRMLMMRGGEVEGLRAAGCPVGTAVRVRELFYNTPARLKFLGSVATERGHCQEWVTRLSLARPEIAFRLTHNGTLLCATSGAGDLKSVLAAVFGATTVRDFLPVNLRIGDLGLSGYVSSPRLTRSTRQQQLFFVNRRFVRSRMMSAALTEAYGMLLPASRNPLCALSVELGPEEVDPNVHPTKIEVRFRNQAEIFSLTREAVAQALAEAGLRSLAQPQRGTRPDLRDATAAPGQRRGFLPAGRLALPDEERRGNIRRLRLSRVAEVTDERDEGLGVYEQPPVVGPRPPSDAAAEPRGSARHPATRTAETLAGPIRILGQHARRYVVAQLGEDLLLIDQHRAAERVAFELLEGRSGPATRQLLVIPLSLELSPTELAAAQASRELLAELGFDTEPFGGAGLLVRSVPAELAHRNPEHMLQGLLANLAAHGGATALAEDELRALAACHGAVKAGEHLSLEEMERLAADLLRTQAPAICPHGDPIILTLEATFLDRKFKRTARAGR